MKRFGELHRYNGSPQDISAIYNTMAVYDTFDSSHN